MQAYADLEIDLHYREADSYGIELRFNCPEEKGEEEILNLLRSLNPISFNREKLRPLEYDPSMYGRLLSESLFADQEVQKYFARIKSVIQRADLGLRVRLVAVPELHNLFWETLQDLEEGTPLAASERLLFSRYLSSLDWRPISSRPRGDLKALVVIANPIDIQKFQLPPLDIQTELQRTRTALKNITTSELASSGAATLDGIVHQLREGFDILYLVCHGALVDNEKQEKVPWLWLENEAGQTAKVSGAEIVNQIKLMEQAPPCLVILASCDSGGSEAGVCTGDHGAFTALGPLLAEAGVPAVLAMQGKIAIATLSQFMPVFFEELNRHGQIDRAVAVARNIVRLQPDWWRPVLFMRLKRGRLWYNPGFFEDKQEWEKWPTLLGRVQEGNCTPILGPAITAAVLGCPEELAQKWAETHRFPMAPYQKEDLPQVAQYLTISQEPDFPRREMILHYCRTIQHRFADVLPESMLSADLCQEMLRSMMARRQGRPAAASPTPEVDLNTLIKQAGAQCRLKNPAEPHAVLASLPLPLFLTTNPDDLMAEALIAAGKEPQIELCRWNDRLSHTPSIFQSDPAYWPDEKKPLIYHIFGHFKDPYSLVLTQDDYFDFLIGIAKNKDLIPEIVRSALSDNALLFLGFHMEDWKFRVLFRTIISQWGVSNRNHPTHVAAQIDPEEDRILDPQRAHRYLERYFNKSQITIYWGGPAEFALDLKQQWENQ